MGTFASLDDAAVAGKRVVLRTDLNVPTKDGAITDLTRIERAATTIKELAEKGARVVILCHFGRPKGAEATYSQKFLVEPLAKIIGRPVEWSAEVIGPDAVSKTKLLPNGGVILMENVRFHPEEEKNDPTFAKGLAELGDLYVNDAFSAAHRAHASTEGMAKLLPRYAGRLMQAELEALSKALEHPEKPVAALVGGAKVSTKLDLLGNLVAKVDMLIIGGGMANTFLYAQGFEIGKSLCEKDLADTAREILEKARAAKCEIVLPTDVAVAGAFAAHAPNKAVPVAEVPADQMILDAGPKSAADIAKRLESCKTLVWNGPLGA
ncbi:MAG TPA: phosphoglycerate kinase, partial [Magnetospirillaceae bacterium]|nr:phosphoglycerate kinase [Magnetospirillaceae bacterium]